MVKVRVGMRFKHSRVLDPMYMPAKVPMIFQITAIRNGFVYYAPVIDYGTRIEIGSSRDKCQITDFNKYALEVL